VVGAIHVLKADADKTVPYRHGLNKQIKRLLTYGINNGHADALVIFFHSYQYVKKKRCLGYVVMLVAPSRNSRSPTQDGKSRYL
jgi:hypothetical protein